MFDRLLREVRWPWKARAQDSLTHPSTNMFMPRAPALASGRPQGPAVHKASVALPYGGSWANEEDRRYMIKSHKYTTTNCDTC